MPNVANPRQPTPLIHRCYTPFLTHFRTRRLKRFYGEMEIRSGTRVADLGGSAFFWELAVRLGLSVPRVTVVNIHPPPVTLPGYIEWIVSDGTKTAFADNTFDVVFCNSVIEHLRDAATQQRLANEIRRLAPRYFVQTPHRLCPIEPHYLTPVVHWLPKSLQRRIVRDLTVWGRITRPTQADCDRIVSELRLLDHRAMHRLFPDAVVAVEKVCGIPKAVIAYR